MNRLKYIIILLVLLTSYIVSVIYLDDVKILAGGNITPVVNPLALWGLVAVGLIAAILLIKNIPSSSLFYQEVETGAKRRDVYLLLVILILFRLFAFLLSPDFIQFMRVWPDSGAYLSDMQAVLQDPARIFDRKSPIYTIWLILNHLTFGKIMDPQSSSTYFGVTVFFSDIVPPIIFQNVIGILTALICFSIFSRINVRLAYAVTLLTFLNPTTLALENAILRESLALFLVLGGFALFLKAVQQKKFIYNILSGVLFVLAYLTRPELIIIYILLCLVLFIYSLLQKQGMWKAVILFCLPLVLSMLVASYSTSREYAEHKYGGRFFTAMYGLKSRCYFYESKTFPELIKNIQKKAMQYEEERGAPCDAPLTTTSLIRASILEEIEKYIQARGLQNSKEEVLDQLFIDVVKNNSSCYIQSVLTNMAYNLIHNVENISPILYDGNNPWISQNWNYYVSPKMLVLYEGNNVYYKYVVYFFRTIEVYTTQKVLFPFFFIGSAIILITIRKGLFTNGSNNNLLMTCILLFSWVHLLFLSLMAGPVARFAYLVSPFTFAIEIIGVMWVYHWFLKLLSDENKEGVKVLRIPGKLLSRPLLFLLVVMIIGIPIYDRYMTYKVGPGYDASMYCEYWNDLSAVKRFITREKLVEKEWLLDMAKDATPGSLLVQYSFPLGNPSFESWHEINNVPEGWSYLQSGSGGRVFRENDAENVKFGSFSARVTKSDRGISQMYYTVSDEDAKRLRGKTILFGCWVKSITKVPNVISVSCTCLTYDNIAPCGYYEKAGEWEFVHLWYRIPRSAGSFNLYLNLENNADAGVYFDGAILATRERFLVGEKPRHFSLGEELSNAYAVWDMDADTKDKLVDSRGGYSATSFNTEIVEGHSGKARYFNGKDSYIQTPVNVQGWKGLTISLWLKPERKEGDELSVILDNGHDAKNNFAIQSADASGEKWVWHCNGIDIFLDIPLNKWTNVVVVADGEKGKVRAYTSGSLVTEVRTDEGFEFGPTPLTIGKLAETDTRYFKGSIDRVVIWGTAIEK